MASTCMAPACLHLPLRTCFEIRVLRVEEATKKIFVCRTDETELAKTPPPQDLLTDDSWNSDTDYVKAEQPLKMSEFHGF